MAKPQQHFIFVFKNLFETIIEDPYHGGLVYQTNLGKGTIKNLVVFTTKTGVGGVGTWPTTNYFVIF